MSSLTDVMSAALAMMMSAALVHFGVNGSGTTDPNASAPPPAAHASLSASASSDSPPIPTDDDRFGAPLPGADRAAPPRAAKAGRAS